MSEPEPRTLAEEESYCSACTRSYPLAYQHCPVDGLPLIQFRAPADPLIGRVLDERFEVLERIGGGGMGTVYRARQRSVGRDVAIKVVHPRRLQDRTAAKRFLREARLASRLSLPSIVAVYDFGQTRDGLLYLVMELARGPTLAELLRAGPLAASRAAGIAAQICDALDGAHAEGIIHRDLKPSNVVVMTEPDRDRVKVLDFGIAKSLTSDSTTMTQSDVIIGTPLYMAPEVAYGHEADARSDLYALGCLLYQMLAGQPPFRGESARIVMNRHIGETPAPLPTHVPAPLAAIAFDLLAKDPSARIPTATAALARLEAARGLDGAPVVAAVAAVEITAPSTLPAVVPASPRPPRAEATEWTRPRRPRWWLAATAAAIAIAVGAGITLVASNGSAPPRPAPAPSPSPSPAPAPSPSPAPAPSPSPAPPPPPAAAAEPAGEPAPEPPPRRRAAPKSKPKPKQPEIDFILPE